MTRTRIETDVPSLEEFEVAIAAELEALVAAGFVETRVHRGVRQYRLTDMGRLMASSERSMQ